MHQPYNKGLDRSNTGGMGGMAHMAIMGDMVLESNNTHQIEFEIPIEIVHKYRSVRTRYQFDICLQIWYEIGIMISEIPQPIWDVMGSTAE